MADNLLLLFRAQVVGTYSTSATSIELSDVTRLDGQVPLNLVLYNKSTGNPVDAYEAGEVEILRVTAVDTGTSTITVERAQEGTTALTITADSWEVYQALTPKVLDAKADLSQLGVQMADQWRLTTSFTGDANPISSNLAQAGTGQIGSAMSVASGEFTFPETGKYLIVFQASFSYPGNSAFASAIINTATDGSTFNIASNVSTSISQVSATNTYGTALAACLFDVTDTGTHKCSFRVDVADNSTTTRGNSGLNETSMFFIKLGET